MPTTAGDAYAQSAWERMWWATWTSDDELAEAYAQEVKPYIMGGWQPGGAWEDWTYNASIHKMLTEDYNEALGILFLASIGETGRSEGFTGGESQTLFNQKIKGTQVRVDMEHPTGGSTGNVHVHLGKNEKIYINNMDELAVLPRAIRKHTGVRRALLKAFELLGRSKK